MTSNARSMIAWTSSGSSVSDIAVKPDTSENITVTIFRSPSMALFKVRIFSARCLGVYDSGLAKRAAGSVVSAAPQDRQNFLPGVTGVPQLGQAASSRAPQSSQKRAPASFSAWHREHFMPGLQAVSPMKVGTVGRE